MFHLPALRGVEGAVVAGGVDTSSERRAAWESDTGARAYESIDDLLERDRPDAIVIATPPDSHAEVCLRAIEAGVHVYCEKPFVSSVQEADAVIAAAAAKGVAIAVNHEFREKPIFKAVRDAARDGRFGRLAFCQISQLMDLAPWDEPTAWRASMSHRTLFEGGVHLVDLLVTFFGEVPEAVYARHSSGFHGDPDADAVQLLILEFSGGRLGQVSIDRISAAATRYVEVRAECERASVRASLGGRAVLQLGMKRAERTGARVDFGLGGLAWAERGTRRKVLARNPRQAGVYGTTRLLEQFVRAAERGDEPPSSAREAREVLAVIEAAYRSAETSARVVISGAVATETVT